MSDLAPVVIFVYNRPSHTKKTIEALALNDLAKESDVFIYSDAAKDKNSQSNVNKTRSYIDTLHQQNLFRSLTIIKAQQNKGLADSVITGVSEIIRKKGKVIVVEDDLISTPDFLTYLNDALLFYENSANIWSISGYSFDLRLPKHYSHDIYYSYRASSWGYATWLDRWETVDWQVSDYKAFVKNHKLKKQFNRGGRDLSLMLISYKLGKVDSWAIRWCYAQTKQNKYTVYPVQSKITNIGFDGSGVHGLAGTEERWATPKNITLKATKLVHTEINSIIARRFKARFGWRIRTRLKLCWGKVF